MYFTSGSDRAFEQLMQTRPGADHFDSGEAGAPEDCGTCRFYRPHWKYQFCVYEECPYYGRYQNVFLTDEEMADLQASFPTVWGQYIEKLSEYMASTGKRYQSHAATIRRWAGEDTKKAVTPSRNRDYSVKEDETV